MKKLLFVLVLSALTLAIVGCNGGTQSPPPNSPPSLNKVTPMPSKKVVFYDFWAPWCPPCRAFSPTFEAWKTKYSNANVEFVKVNSDEDKELTTRFNISSLPTIIVTVDGVEAKRWVGAPKESDILPYLK